MENSNKLKQRTKEECEKVEALVETRFRESSITFLVNPNESLELQKLLVTTIRNDLQRVKRWSKQVPESEKRVTSYLQFLLEQNKALTLKEIRILFTITNDKEISLQQNRLKSENAREKRKEKEKEEIKKALKEGKIHDDLRKEYAIPILEEATRKLASELMQRFPKTKFLKKTIVNHFIGNGRFEDIEKRMKEESGEFAENTNATKTSLSHLQSKRLPDLPVNENHPEYIRNIFEDLSVEKRNFYAKSYKIPSDSISILSRNCNDESQMKKRLEFVKKYLSKILDIFFSLPEKIIIHQLSQYLIQEENPDYKGFLTWMKNNQVIEKDRRGLKAII